MVWTTRVDGGCAVSSDIHKPVGYKKPPKAYQFKKGHSGNHSGRPREIPGIPELLAKVARQKVLTNTKSGPKSMSKLEAGITQLVNKAAGGDLKAWRFLKEMLVQFPQAVKGKNTEQEATDAKNKLLAALERYNG